MAGKVNRFWRHTLGVIIIFIIMIVYCAKKRTIKMSGVAFCSLVLL